MKITIDLPESTFREAKSVSAERGESLKDFVAEAIQARINALRTGRSPEPTQPRWLANFGELSQFRTEIESM